jgi:hypothetical protein
VNDDVVKVHRDRPIQQNPTVLRVINVSTLISCFPPFRPPCFGEFGATFVTHFFREAPLQMKAQIQQQISSILWQQMPDLRLLVQLSRCDLIEAKFLEVLLMNEIDSQLNGHVDFPPIIDLAYEKTVQMKSFRINEFERVERDHPDSLPPNGSQIRPKELF